MTRRVRLSSVVSEAWRNLLSGTTRATTFTLLAAVLLVGTAGTDVRTVVGLSQQAAEFRDSGAAVVQVTSQGSVSGARCDALGQVPGVLGAGATRTAATQHQVHTSPRAGLTTLEATPGLAGVLGVEPTGGAGVWLSSTASASLGAPVGTVLPTSGGAVAVTGTYTYPEAATDRAPAHAMIAPVPPEGSFDTCWVRTWPQSETVVALARGVTTGGPDKDVTTGQLTTRLGASLDGYALFEGRPTRLLLAVAAVGGLLLGVVALRVRRLELAGALHAQVPRSALVLQTTLETAAVALAAAVVAAPVTFLLASSGNPDPVWPAYLAGLRVIAVGACSVVVGGLLAVGATSEKRLFAYFKDR